MGAQPRLPGEQGARTFIPAEAVYAAFEVKQRINRAHVEYASEKVASIRRLERTSAPIVHAGGRIGDPKPPPPILGGLLTTGSDWTPPLGDPFISALSAPDQQAQLDLGCVVNTAGWRFVQPEGDPYVQLSAKGEALVHFYLNLLAELQQLGTVPAMDFDVWRTLLTEITLN